MAERKLSATDVLRPVIKVGLLGLGAGIFGGVSVTLRSHRELTHRSITLHPILQKIFDFEQRTITLNSKLWAAVHRTHHEMSDVALGPFGRIANAVNWIGENPDKAQGVEIPKTYQGLDPVVDVFTLDQVMKIGTLANQFFRERLGKRYQEPEDYSTEGLNEILTKSTHKYSNQKHEGDYTLEEMEDNLGGDPHSPARFPDSNGVRSELFHIPKVYQGLAGLFRAHPELLPEDLQSEDGQVRQYGKFDAALGVAIFSAAVLVTRGKYTPRDFLIAALEGTAIDGIKWGLQLLGGNTVNALGHAGNYSEGQTVRVIQNHEYKIQPNVDGTVATKGKRMSLIDSFLNRLTLDEAFRQWEHHFDPSKIAYTFQKGFQAWNEAPFGSIVDFLAQSRLFPLINPGSGFDFKEGERRPDELHLAGQIINDIRAAQAMKAREQKLFSGTIA